jgi:hypothetical protein
MNCRCRDVCLLQSWGVRFKGPGRTSIHLLYTIPCIPRSRRRPLNSPFPPQSPSGDAAEFPGDAVLRVDPLQPARLADRLGSRVFQ